MTGVARKIAIAEQIAEMQATLEEPPTAARARQQEDRLRRRRGILATLEFCQAHELAIRGFIAGTHGEREYILEGGRLMWRRKDRAGGDDFTPMTEAEANDVLKVLCGMAAD